MREAIGNSLLLNLVIIFAGIVILFFIGIISYSKAYRVKNRIIEIIEKSETYDYNSSEIAESLRNAGYTLSPKKCEKTQNHLNKIGLSVDAEKDNMNKSDYNYCVYKVETKSTYHYIVATFVHFDFPLIGEMMNLPVYGETKTLGRNYNY